MGDAGVTKACRLVPGVAAGHPATARAGLDALEAGGSAADAAVAASLASCVAETVMTGLLGGGHATWWDAAAREAWALDCFVDVPGRGATREPRPLDRLAVPFGEEEIHYAIGPASCAVPGLPAGLSALHERFGRLPWSDLVEPARRLALDGVPMPPAHADCLVMLAPVLTLDAGGRIYAPAGRPLTAGERLEQPGLADALGLLADEGPASAYTGTIAARLLELVDERGGAVTGDDLRSYRAAWSRAPATPAGELTLHARTDGLGRIPQTLASLPPLRCLSPARRVGALAEALVAPPAPGHTTNIVAADAEGNVCVLTSSLGLGSGDYVPGLDLHLNSMLGEVDLLVGELRTGERMASMMTPLVAVDRDGPVLGIGAAGGSRLRTALVTVAAGIVEEGLAPQAAVDRPRFHPAEGVVNAEPGVDEGGLAALEARGWHVRRWPRRHHYFGGVSAIGRTGAGADPRRSGAAMLVG